MYTVELLVISLILFWHVVDGVVFNCTAYPDILQQIPDSIEVTYLIANSSSEEISWTNIPFADGVQFPLQFIHTVNSTLYTPGTYIHQLNIYKKPRGDYDLPLWSAEASDTYLGNGTYNKVMFNLHNDRPPSVPCIMGIILSTNRYYTQSLLVQLDVKIGTLQALSIPIPMLYFPILFMLTDIPVARTGNSSIVSISATSSNQRLIYEAKQKAIITNKPDCITLLFKASEQKSVNLTITISSNMLASKQLLGLMLTYKVYKGEIFIHERSMLIDILEFPFRIPTELIPITTSSNYTIEVMIIGPHDRFPTSTTYFQGVKYVQLVPGTNNNVKVSLIYTGPVFGTSIFGRINRTPANQATWSLANSYLAVTLDDSTSGSAGSYQFKIFEQTFPIEFMLVNVTSLNQSSSNVIITVTITYPDGTVIWSTTIQDTNIIYNALNRLNVIVSTPDGYACREPGKGYCSTSSTTDINNVCCAQYKCSHGECKLP